MDTLIIAFGHKARRGKDTAVQAILDARSNEFDVRRYAFADALKKEVNDAAEKHGGMLALFTHLGQHSRLPMWVKYDPSPDMTDPLSPLGKQRNLLQWWGTEYRRAEDPYYWVKALKHTLETDKPQIALISDLRTLNEASWVKSGESNRIVTIDRVGMVDVLDAVQVKHTSECELDNVKYWDYELLVEEGDIEGLKQAVVTGVFDDILSQMSMPEDINQFPDAQITQYKIDESKLIQVT